jgi:hypothetical protein
VPPSGWPSWRILLPSGIMASPVAAQERRRGWLCGSFPFDRHQYADSRVQLTEGRKMHNRGHGDVLSSRGPTTPVMVLQHAGWWHSSGDGCTGPTVTEETHSTGHGVVPRGRGIDVRTLCPLLRVRCAGHTGVGGTVSRSLHWPYRTTPYSDGDGLARRVGGTAPRFALDPGARDVSQHLMLRSGEWGGGPTGALERGGVLPEGAHSPRAGGVSPEGASRPRARRSCARGGIRPSSEA